MIRRGKASLVELITKNAMDVPWSEREQPAEKYTEKINKIKETLQQYIAREPRYETPKEDLEDFITDLRSYTSSLSSDIPMPREEQEKALKDLLEVEMK